MTTASASPSPPPCSRRWRAAADDTDELRAKIAEVKSRPGGRIEPLPEVKPYETFAYAAAGPALAVRGRRAGVGGRRRTRCGPTPTARASSSSSSRSTRCAWSARCASAARNYGLVQTKDGLVHRVLPGNHLGQSDGRITAIEEGKISLIEIVPDGMGGFIERPAALALSE